MEIVIQSHSNLIYGKFVLKYLEITLEKAIFMTAFFENFLYGYFMLRFTLKNLN